MATMGTMGREITFQDVGGISGTTCNWFAEEPIHRKPPVEEGGNSFCHCRDNISTRCKRAWPLKLGSLRECRTFAVWTAD